MPEKNLNYPILIEIGNSSGSGFLFHKPDSNRLFLATAAHVLYDLQTNELLGPEIKFIVPTGIHTKPKTMTGDVSKLVFRRDKTVDIALIEMGETTSTDKQGSYDVKIMDGIIGPPEGLQTTHVPFTSFIKFKDVIIGNDVFVLGYPRSLAKGQIEYDRPLLRKGVIAGINQSQKTIIIDCPVYFGNSGGLALQVSRTSDGLQYNAIGVVSQYIPFIEELVSQLGYKNTNLENSGYGVVVPTDTIFALTGEEPQEDLEVQVSAKISS